MLILVYGSKGWIGSQFIKLLKKNNIKYISGNERANNIPKLKQEINNVKPTHIISFIGRTHGKIDDKVYTTIDYLEQKGKIKENVRDNLFSPLVLAIVCKQLNIHYTYLGTGCIFKFDQDHPFGKEVNGFIEESLPNFFGSGYSTVKGYTDQLMHFFNESVLNLRIRMPITGTQNGRNFITKITTYEYICSIPNSMTVLPELLPKVIKLMQMNYTGTLNLTNPGLISHNQILEMFQQIVDPEFKWKNFTKEEQSKILAGDRSNNFLDTTKLKTLFPDLKNIKDSVKDCLIEYKKTYQKKIVSNDYISKIKNLLVTGCCGFIGSNFINYFAKQHSNINIINIDAMYYCANENNVLPEIRNSNKYKFIKCNINNTELVSYILENNNIDTVIHFAAQSHVQNSFTNSIQFTKDNILGTHNLLEECRKYGKINKFIHVSTDEVYGESMNQVNEKSKTEHSILCPTNPYAASKAGAELIVQSYYHSFKMPIIITRGNNVYGPNQYPEKLIPKFIKLLKEDKKVTIQGNGSAVRGFLHSYDTATAFEAILNKGKLGEIYNIGCNEKMEYSVMDIAKKLIKMIKNTDDYNKWITYIEDRPFNDQRYYISNQKLRDLAWKIKIDFNNGLINLINLNSKIDLIYLNKINSNNNLKYFGNWINNIDILAKQFINAKPFQHIRIDNFLNEEYINLIYNEFPNNFNDWWKYNNPLEVKYANDKINDFNENIKKIFYILSSNQLINVFSQISKIDELEYDPYLHGAGLHVHPKYGRLNLHLDYEKHPQLINKQRRLNIILFLNKKWKKEWNGDNQLWNKDVTECKVRTYPKFNTALIFNTNEISWHGVPEKILCPEGNYRKTLAYYYISPLKNNNNNNNNKFGNNGSGYRTKASFIKRPKDKDLIQLKKLYKIRPMRRIEKEDMNEIWPEWTPEIF